MQPQNHKEETQDSSKTMEAQGTAEEPQGLRYKVGERETGRTIQVMNLGGAMEKLAMDFCNETKWN